MKAIIIRLSIIVGILGVIALCLNAIFGLGTINYLTSFQVGGLTFHKYNFNAYFNNLATSIQDTAVLELAWQDLQWNSDLLNDLKYIANIFIFGINLLIYPFRLGAYVVKTLLAILGVNFTNIEGSKITWLTNLIDWLVKFSQGYLS